MSKKTPQKSRKEEHRSAKGKPAEDTPVNRAVEAIKFVETPGATRLPAITQQKEGRDMTKNKTLEFDFRTINKNGLLAYQPDGVVASTYFNKTLFSGEGKVTKIRMEILESEGEVGFTQPGETVVRGFGAKPMTEERKAKIEAEAAKQRARGEKALEASDKKMAKIRGITVEQLRAERAQQEQKPELTTV